MFLAEIIRSRRTSLARAAEISQRVVRMLPAVRSESQTLSMLTDIEKEFEEIAALKQALHFGYSASDVKVYEKEIKEFASDVFLKDMAFSVSFLKDAAKTGISIQQLCLKYPQFCNFLFDNSDKSSLLTELKAV